MRARCEIHTGLPSPHSSLHRENPKDAAAGKEAVFSSPTFQDSILRNLQVLCESTQGAFRSLQEQHPESELESNGRPAQYSCARLFFRRSRNYLDYCPKGPCRSCSCSKTNDRCCRRRCGIADDCAFSLKPQRYQRIHPRRSPRGKPASHGPGCYHDRAHHSKRCRVVRRHAKQLAR